MNDEKILLLIEVSNDEKSCELFRDKVPFYFENEEAAIDAFYYMAQNADKYIHSAQFLKL